MAYSIFLSNSRNDCHFFFVFLDLCAATVFSTARVATAAPAPAAATAKQSMTDL